MVFTNQQTSIMARSVVEQYGDAAHAINILLPHGGTASDLVRVLQHMVTADSEQSPASCLHQGLLKHALNMINYDEVADYVLHQAARSH